MVCPDGLLTLLLASYMTLETCGFCDIEEEILHVGRKSWQWWGALYRGDVVLKMGRSIRKQDSLEPT